MEVLTIVCVVLVVVVNGWTDAPNAITAVVSSGAMPYGRAVGLAAVCNLLGVVLGSLWLPGVTRTMVALSQFPGASPKAASLGICCALVTVALWGAAAWVFGIPTSESHALLAGIAGVSAALGGFSGLDGSLWLQVLLGMAVSLALGWALSKIICLCLGRWLGTLSRGALALGQKATAAGLAFYHGAQDGQKFIAMLAAAGLSGGRAGPLLAVLLCGAAMTMGTSLGGRRIIENMGGRLTQIDLESGICGDLGAVTALSTTTLMGWPVSTSHLRVAALWGCAPRLDKTALGEMVWAWVLTFPICFGAACLLTQLVAGPL